MIDGYPCGDTQAATTPEQDPGMAKLISDGDAWGEGTSTGSERGSAVPTSQAPHLCWRSPERSAIEPPTFFMHQFGRCFPSFAMNADRCDPSRLRYTRAGAMVIKVDNSSWIGTTDRFGVHKRWLPIVPLNLASPSLGC